MLGQIVAKQKLAETQKPTERHLKRTPLLNRHLSSLVASLGHLDQIVLADAGLPVPPGVAVIDLAVMPGVPNLWDVATALRSEMVIEEAVTATEASPELSKDFNRMLDAWARETGKSIHHRQVNHATFKQQTQQARAVIRTGEVTPYANLILVSSVPF